MNKGSKDHDDIKMIPFLSEGGVIVSGRDTGGGTRFSDFPDQKFICQIPPSTLLHGEQQVIEVNDHATTLISCRR